jgi:oligoendopeptidase F
MYKEYEENGSITKEFMDKTVIDSLHKYYGDTIKLDDNSNTSWIIRSHYYMNYYLYSYAFCISVASYVAKHILDGDTAMLNKYIDFLSTGEDTWPIDVFKKLDVDLTEEKVYEDAIQYFNEMLNKYKEIRES